jgi:hypothetical protein
MRETEKWRCIFHYRLLLFCCLWLHDVGGLSFLSSHMSGKQVSSSLERYTTEIRATRLQWKNSPASDQNHMNRSYLQALVYGVDGSVMIDDGDSTSLSTRTSVRTNHNDIILQHIVDLWHSQHQDKLSRIAAAFISSSSSELTSPHAIDNRVMLPASSSSCLQLSDIEDVEIVSLGYDHLHIQTSVCAGTTTCLAVLTPIQFPCSCGECMYQSNNDDMNDDCTNDNDHESFQNCVLQQMIHLDSVATNILSHRLDAERNYESIQTNYRQRQSLLQNTDDAFVISTRFSQQYRSSTTKSSSLSSSSSSPSSTTTSSLRLVTPLWWVDANTPDLIQECSILQRMLNEDEFAAEIQALATIMTTAHALSIGSTDEQQTIEQCYPHPSENEKQQVSQDDNEALESDLRPLLDKPELVDLVGTVVLVEQNDDDNIQEQNVLIGYEKSEAQNREFQVMQISDANKTQRIVETNFATTNLDDYTVEYNTIASDHQDECVEPSRSNGKDNQRMRATSSFIGSVSRLISFLPSTHGPNNFRAVAGHHVRVNFNVTVAIDLGVVEINALDNVAEDVSFVRGLPIAADGNTNALVQNNVLGQTKGSASLFGTNDSELSASREEWMNNATSGIVSATENDVVACYSCLPGSLDRLETFVGDYGPSVDVTTEKEANTNHEANNNECHAAGISGNPSPKTKGKDIEVLEYAVMGSTVETPQRERINKDVIGNLKAIDTAAVSGNDHHMAGNNKTVVCKAAPEQSETVAPDLDLVCETQDSFHVKCAVVDTVGPAGLILKALAQRVEELQEDSRNDQILFIPVRYSGVVATSSDQLRDAVLCLVETADRLSKLTVSTVKG